MAKKPAKSVSSEVLPSRHAMAQIVKGDPYYRSMSNYAKKTPADASGLGPMMLMRMFGGR